MTKQLKVHLDRTLCDGFGVCAKHAPEYFSLDDWGYACLTGDGTVPDEDREAVLRALMDCPAHAIMRMDERRLDNVSRTTSEDDDPGAHLVTESNEAEWGFTR